MSHYPAHFAQGACLWSVREVYNAKIVDIATCHCVELNESDLGDEHSL